MGLGGWFRKEPMLSTSWHEEFVLCEVVSHFFLSFRVPFQGRQLGSFPEKVVAIQHCPAEVVIHSSQNDFSRRIQYKLGKEEEEENPVHTLISSSPYFDMPKLFSVKKKVLFCFPLHNLEKIL